MSKPNAFKHGLINTPTYNSWRSMIQRCRTPSSNRYHRYGGRGIRVCERWLDFRNFYEDMGEKPPSMQLDRVDNDSGYSPENCRWASPIQNANNRSSNAKYTFSGTTHTIAEWSRIVGIGQRTLRYRLLNMTIQKALKLNGENNG